MASYYVWSAAAGAANGTSWTNAYTTLTLAFSGKVAGDIFYVAHDHSESTAAALTLTTAGTAANPSKVICVDRAGTVPPVSADRRTTAQVANTGTNNIGLTGFTHYDGIIFVAGAGGSGAAIINVPNLNGQRIRFDNCSLRLGSTSISSLINVGNAGIASASSIELNNTTLSFASVSHKLVVGGTVEWRNTPSAIIGTAVPTTLLDGLTQRGGAFEAIGVDLSALGSGKTIVGTTVSQAISTTFRFVDCKLDAAVTKSGVPLTHSSQRVDFIRSGASGVNYTVYVQRMAGALNEELTVVRTGGASDGTTPIAWKIDTTANCNYSMPFECPPIAIWNDTTGSAKTATIEGIWGGGAVPNDDDVWVEVEYLGSSSTPLGSFVNDGKANLLTTAVGQTGSSETWGGSTTKFKLNVTFTAQQKGWVYARVKCAKASSTFYIDPLVTLT